VKRFYKAVATAAVDGHFAVNLDGRPIRTPKRAPLAVPTAALAEAIAAEWDAQGEEILPATMPLTGIANAAIDWVVPDPAAFAAPLAAYGETDLLCYRAPEPPLARAEAEGWNPILAWAETRLCVEFTLVTGIIHQPQPAATVAALRDALLAHDPFRLAALSPIITIGGSLVVALAHVSKAFDSETLWQAVTLDERWQEEQWGVDDQAAQQRARHHAEWQTATRFLSLLD
jgi:chaperone required for assembly of F1-ATPase